MTDVLKAEWDVWRHARIVQVWEAAALSVNIDPRKLTRGSKRAFDALPVAQEISDRTALARTRAGGLSLEQTDSSSPNRSTVGLAVFGSWAAAQGWKLPVEFPRLQDTSAVARQDRRLKMCIEAGLKMPSSSVGRLPRGIGKLAAQDSVTRQTFTADVKAALARKGRTQVHKSK